MLTQFAYSNSRFLACISQIVDRGSFPRRIPNASRPIYRSIRPRQVLPYSRMPRRSLTDDRLTTFPAFRSTRPGYFCCDLPCTQTFRKHNDRERAPSTGGDLYRTCTPNVIHNDHPVFHWHSIHEHISLFTIQIHEPTDRPRQL